MTFLTVDGKTFFRGASDKPIEVRVGAPSELLDKMYAHEGYCKYCEDDTVKMHRSFDDLRLMPDQCRCICCGQAYHMDIKPEQLDAWEAEQWKQKASSVELVKLRTATDFIEDTKPANLKDNIWAEPWHLWTTAVPSSGQPLTSDMIKEAAEAIRKGRF